MDDKLLTVFAYQNRELAAFAALVGVIASFFPLNDTPFPLSPSWLLGYRVAGLLVVIAGVGILLLSNRHMQKALRGKASEEADRGMLVDKANTLNLIGFFFALFGCIMAVTPHVL